MTTPGSRNGVPLFCPHCGEIAKRPLPPYPVSETQAIHQVLPLPPQPETTLTTTHPAPNASEPRVPNGEYRELQLGGSARSATDDSTKPWAQHPVRTLHACVETLAEAFKGYLPWPDEKRDSVVRGHEMLIRDTIKRADACMTIIKHAESARSSTVPSDALATLQAAINLTDGHINEMLRHVYDGLARSASRDRAAS